MSAVDAARSATATTEQLRMELVQSLRDSGASLDRLWLDAAAAGSDDALRLADAAQSVHRALVALTSP